MRLLFHDLRNVWESLLLYTMPISYPSRIFTSLPLRMLMRLHPLWPASLWTTSNLGKLPPCAELLHLFTSLSLAIDYAHQNGIIHGHIKPSSILLGKNTSSQNKIGEPLLIDFELSGILQNSSSFSEPYYLAPEQIRGYPANERSDVYTLGIILYELCTGVLPFRGNRRVAIMMQHINAL